MPAVSTAAGRAMLAHSGAQAVEEIATQTARLTEAAVDPDELAATLAEVRGNGYGVDVEESSAGVCCVGAAVFDHTGAVTAAISISTPSSRFANDDLAVQGRAARVAADELSAVLGAPPDAGSRRSPHTTAFHRSSASASQGSSA